jgi:hypothetical protein
MLAQDIWPIGGVNAGGSSSGLCLDVLQPLTHSLFIDNENCSKSLILGGGGDIILSQGGQKPFFMFTWQMERQPFEEVAISPESGPVSTLRRERNIFASNHFHESPHRFTGIHPAIVIYEQLVVY